MIVETKEFARYTAFTFADGVVVRVKRRRDHRPGNPYDMGQLAQRADMIRASESHEVKELYHAISSIAHHSDTLRAYATKIESGKGPLADAILAHRYANPSKIAKGLRKAMKGIRAGIAAVYDSGFMESASAWNGENVQADEDVQLQSPAEPAKPKRSRKRTAKATVPTAMPKTIAERMNAKPATNGHANGKPVLNGTTH